MELAIATSVSLAINYGISYLSNQNEERKSDDDVIAKSSYGFSLEQPYGRIRLNNRNLFWAPALEETEEEGKGRGNSQTQYLATFAVIISWGSISAVNRIWFGKELVYNSSPNATAKTREESTKFFHNHLEIYYGSTSQAPSPTIEEYEGVGNVNSLKKVSYLVFKNYPQNVKSFPTVDVEITRGDPPVSSPAILPADTLSSDSLEFIIRDLGSKVNIQSPQLEFDSFMQHQLVNGTVFKQDGSSPNSFIEQLQKLYFFFPDDRGDKIVWKHQTTAESESIVTLTDDDLRAQEVGNSPIDPYEQIFVDQREIPSHLELEYLNPDLDYDLGNQPAWDQGAQHSKDEVIRTAVVLHDSAASNICWQLMGQLITQKRKFEKISLLPSLGQQIKIGQLVTIPVEGQNTLIQISQKDIGVNDLYEFSGVIYDRIQPDFEINNNYYPQSDVDSIPIGQVIPLDLPLIQDGDSDFGVYIAVQSSDNWKLGEIYLSSDLGSTYSKVAEFTGRSTTGIVTQLPDSNVDAKFIDYGSEIIVQLDNNKTLESLTDSNFYDLNNLGLFGSELIAWRDEELIGPNLYKLSHLLRGQRGTEWAINTHTQNERFVLLRGKGKKLIRLQGQQTDLGKTLFFKAVHAGSSLDEVTPTAISITGEALRPYTPTNLTLTKYTATGDLKINWTLRTRRYGAMVNGTGITQVDSEKVFIEILDAQNNLVRSLETTKSEYLYTAAEQISDRGSLQTELSFNIAQASTFIGSGRALEIRNLQPRIFI